MPNSNGDRPYLWPGARKQAARARRDIDESMEVQPSVSTPKGFDKSGRLIYSPGRTRDDPFVPTPGGKAYWLVKPPSPEKSLKKGGKVKKTGVYKLHKGEKVIKASTAKKIDRKPVTAKQAAPKRRRRK